MNNIRKGIILAGGNGYRLKPLTSVINKQLLPVYDKPMIYYPISTLMLANIRDILIITTPHQKEFFESLIGNGSKWGIKIYYEIQKLPEGLAQAFTIGEKFIGSDPVALILGDNLFHGSDLTNKLIKASNLKHGASIFAYPVRDAREYGIIEFNSDGSPKRLEEKPQSYKNKYAITGLYFYDNSVIEKAYKVKPSERGELEITTINAMYLRENKLHVEKLNRGVAWLDTGTIDTLHQASSYIRILEKRQGLKIGCPEEVSWRKGWIDDNDLIRISDTFHKSSYGEYLKEITNE